MLILADNDVGGAVTALRRILESEEWAEFSAILALRFAEFADVSLARDASDRVVWQTCQEVGAVLITGNRTSGDDSLEQTIRDHIGPDGLPVVTIGDPQRLVRAGRMRARARCVYSIYWNASKHYAEQAGSSFLDGEREIPRGELVLGTPLIPHSAGCV
jgi:hypothetical protein